MNTIQRRQVSCRSANGEIVVLTETEGSVGNELEKQFSLPNGHLVNARDDGTFQVSASGEILVKVE
ncbi:hypothetical protein NGM99_21335 [Mesorhizobium sp. RP14(2022)]|uniref:Uncharacterized protein n=1 Tax=Mesorhizobium liriopis TaxID=2953882 RepID=A0ABT1CDR2_9HYPH|nr:hypothetical protein [Mesorhizobium liriopis]MCO6052336.1 hypothetical protein [Mesorhizobium liriopis]